MEDFGNCSCHLNGGKRVHNYPLLETLLPTEYDYVICTYKESSLDSIVSRFHMNCATKEEAYEWLETCVSITNVTLSIERENNFIEAKCHCMKKDHPCETGMTIILDQFNPSKSSSHFDVLRDHSATVIFRYTHDLSEIPDILVEEVDIASISSLDNSCDEDFERLDPQDDSQSIFSTDDESKPLLLDEFIHKKLYHLFEKDYSPQQAYNLYKKDLHEIFTAAKLPRNERPTLKWVYQQYYTFFEQKHGVKIVSDLKTTRVKRPITRPQLDDKLKHLASPPPTSPNDQLGTKIDELCKKYVPILPATSSCKANKPDPLTTKPSKSTPQNNAFSYIIKFNSEPTTAKLNLFPLKLIPNNFKTHDNFVFQNRLPELKIIQNSKDHHILKVIGTDQSKPQNISIPSGVDGIIILANDQQPPKPITIHEPIILDDPITTDEPLANDEPTTNESIPKVPSNPSEKKHRRKANLKYDDIEEIVFTDKVEELGIQEQSVVRKSKRKNRIIRKNDSYKKKKISLSNADVDGIENVICLD